MDKSLLTRLSAAWAAEDVRPAGPASSDAIAAFEHRHGVSVPPDFRLYLETLNGAQGGRDAMGNKETFAFWHLDEIEPEDVGGVRVLPFADFLIDSHRYVIALSAEPGGSTPILIHHHNGSLIRIADSFSDFVRAYIAGDEDILHGVRASSGPSA
jgi:SMI1/KNR4 family protein SUKH-1